MNLIDACIGSVACDGSTAGACAKTLKDQILKALSSSVPQERTDILARLQDFHDQVRSGFVSLSRSDQMQVLQDVMDALNGQSHP